MPSNVLRAATEKECVKREEARIARQECARARSDVGRRAEDVVADLMFAAGFSLLARNVRIGALELDIVARKAALVVVVEVRTRASGSWTTALESVTRTKRARLRRAVAALWPRALAMLPGVKRVRLDVAAVTFTGVNASVEYVPGALG